MPEALKIATINGGGTWGRILDWLAGGMKAAGLPFELLKLGGEVPELALAVDEGAADISVTTTFAARAARAGKAPYARPLRISGLGEIQYPMHWFVGMVRADLEIESFAALAEKHPAVRLCLPAPNMTVAYPVKAIFGRFGIDPYKDIAGWGGEVITDFSSVPRLLASGAADGVFRENSPLRYDPARSRAMKFFSLTEDQAGELAADLAIKPGLIPAGAYKNQQRDLWTLDAEGFTLYCRSDLPEETAYQLAEAVDRSTATHYLGSSIFYSSRFAVMTGTPLHPGAESYFRRLGYF
jgi:TRAP-type uncharacterized transport system substrate-binding protein